MRVFTFASKTSPTAPPHQTTLQSNGMVVCTCLGFRHPKKCWHVREVLRQYPLPDKEWAEALELMREKRHPELLQLIQSVYPNLTREEIPALIHTLCEWKCQECGAEHQSPQGDGCTLCGEVG